MDKKFKQITNVSILVYFITALVIFGFVGACQKGTNENLDGQPTVILISLDGFRWDYPEKADTPNLDFLMRSGVRAKMLIPVFPTKTFPNHYTIATGLYPEHHGIIANYMYDPIMNARFSLSNRDAVQDGRWWGGEPIWVTAEKQGQISAAYFWAGSEAKIKGVQPTYWYLYNDSVTAETRVEQVLHWLDLLKTKRPTLLTCYFRNLDDTGHRFGPESKEVVNEIQKVDGILGMLLKGLEQRDILNRVNILIVSDHGMAETSRDRVILLDDFIDLKSVDIVDWTPILALNPKSGSEDAVYQKLVLAHPHLKIYRKADIPERLHFNKHHRIPAIIGIADEGWEIASRSLFNSKPNFGKGGTHGYDNQLKSMGAIFIARGPAFKSGSTMKPFQNIHIYNLLAEILELEPAPNDGNLDSVKVALRR